MCIYIRIYVYVYIHILVWACAFKCTDYSISSANVAHRVQPTIWACCYHTFDHNYYHDFDHNLDRYNLCYIRWYCGSGRRCCQYKLKLKYDHDFSDQTVITITNVSCDDFMDLGLDVATCITRCCEPGRELDLEQNRLFGPGYVGFYGFLKLLWIWTIWMIMDDID